MTEALPHEEITPRFAGKKGEHLTVTHRVFYSFRIDELRPTDIFDGRATQIEGFFIGAATQFYLPPNPGVLSADFWPWWKSRGTSFTKAALLIDISFCLKFLEDCEWSAKLIGWASGKEEGDTREIARERAVREYERSCLQSSPKAADNPQFQEMIKRMLETP